MQLTMVERRKKHLGNECDHVEWMVYLIKIWLSDSFIANNDAIVYLDAATWSYQLQPAQLVRSQEAQTTLTNVIGR
jgi:hypothetical protein